MSDSSLYRVVSRDDDGGILRIWGDYDESRAHQLAASLRKENWAQTYAVEPANGGTLRDDHARQEREHGPQTPETTASTRSRGRGPSRFS